MEVDDKIQAVALIAGLGAALYLAGYDPVGMLLGWIEFVVSYVSNWIAQQVQSAVGGIWGSLGDAFSF
ncbi:MAG: hypothetical protein ABEJ68_07675 [Halobacteriaceae archaeon]